MSTIRTIIKYPGWPARFTHIDNELEMLQRIVGGYIETLTVDDRLVMIFNEEGRLAGLPTNFFIEGVELVGPVIVAGYDGEGELTDIPKEIGTRAKLEERFPQLLQSQPFRICPRCGKAYIDRPAVSRRNREDICPECGQMEALEDYRRFSAAAKRRAQS